MGYGGQAIQIVKANRALLKKDRTFKKVKEMFLDSAQITALEFKEVSLEKLARIKSEIRKKAKEDAWKENAFYLVTSLIILYAFYRFTMSLFFE